MSSRGPIYRKGFAGAKQSRVEGMGDIPQQVLENKPEPPEGTSDSSPLDELDGSNVDDSPGRSLDTAFQPNGDRPVRVSYTIRIVSAPGEAGQVFLRSDSADPPTKIRERARCRAAGGSTSVDVGIPVSYVVPPGHFVLLDSAQEVGSPIISILDQTEITL